MLTRTGGARYAGRAGGGLAESSSRRGDLREMNGGSLRMGRSETVLGSRKVDQERYGTRHALRRTSVTSLWPTVQYGWPKRGGGACVEVPVRG